MKLRWDLSILATVLAAVLAVMAYPEKVWAESENPRVKLETSAGVMVLELDTQKAPLTVANFLQYVNDGFYDGTIFHRVIKDFMIQGGGFTQDYQQKETRAPIKNEADNGLTNARGTLAMARTSQPHSATAQFFINSVDNDFLNHRAPSGNGWGYAVFGRVVEGLEVVDKISGSTTGAGGPFPQDVPEKTIVIERVRQI